MSAAGKFVYTDVLYCDKVGVGVGPIVWHEESFERHILHTRCGSFLRREGASQFGCSCCRAAQLLGLTSCELSFICNAGNCTSCGEGVKANRTDLISVYNPIDYSVTNLSVSSSSEDCCECSFRRCAQTLQGDCPAEHNRTRHESTTALQC